MLILCVGSSVLSAQKIEMPLRKAQQLRSVGKYHEAKDLLEPVYKQNTGNPILYNELKQIYLALEMYQPLLEMIEFHIKHQPKNMKYPIEKAQILAKTDRQEAAFDLWEDVLKEYGNSSTVYHMVANTMAQERLFDKAIMVYLKGRQSSGDENRYALNLAGLYASTIQFEKAAQEYIRYVIKKPTQASFVEGQILRFPFSSGVFRSLVSQLESAIEEKPDLGILHQLLSRVYIKREDYDMAFETIKRAESVWNQKEHIKALIHLAQIAGRAGKYAVSEKIYFYTERTYPKNTSSDRIMEGLAQVMLDQKKYSEAITVYDRIITSFEGKPAAPRALIQKGRVLRDSLQVPLDAKKYFLLLKHDYDRSEESKVCSFEIGKCFLALGQWIEAEKILLESLEKDPSVSVEFEVETIVRLAEAQAVQGRYDEALATLKNLDLMKMSPEKISQPFINDGLLLKLYIQEYRQSDTENLKTFLASKTFQSLRQWEKSLICLDSLMNMNPSVNLIPRILFDKAIVLYVLNRPNLSLSVWDMLLTKYSQVFFADEAWEKSGLVLLGMGKTKEAIKRFEELITVYPHSFISERARKRIRDLGERGDDR